MVINRWDFQTPSEEGSHKRDQLVAKLGFSPMICLLFAQRNVTSIEETRKFFKPSLNDLHNPLLIPDMNKTVRRLNKALRNKEKILIYGGYNVDGTTAVPFVFRYLRLYSSTLNFHIPDRYNEGYGIPYKGTNCIAENGVSLVILPDCGVRAIGGIEYAKEKSIDFIIYNHHMPDAILPNAVTISDVRHSDSIYPYEHLSGCRARFKLIQVFVKNNNSPFSDLEKLLELAAVNIASDIVSIIGENRILAYYGLRQLSNNLGLRLEGIIDTCGLAEKEVTISDIVLEIDPRVNTPGCMMNGKEAVELLLSKDSASAREESESINQYNEERRKLDKRIADEANAIIDEVESMDGQRAIVVYNPGWHKDVIGIVASRLTEKYYRPAVILTKSSRLIAGSTCSVMGSNICKAIKSCRDSSENFGGHIYTARLSLREENPEVFTKRFLRITSEKIIPGQIVPQTDIGAILGLEEISQELMNGLKKVSPFGPDNQKPIFCSPGAKGYSTSKPVDKELEHLKLELIDGNSSTPVHTIIFGIHRYNDHTKSIKPFNICYMMEENTCNGNTSIQLMIKDVKPSDI